jgi:hypothetical protein
MHRQRELGLVEQRQLLEKLQPDLQVPQVHKVFKVRKDYRVRKAFKVYKEHKEKKVRRARKAIPVHKVRRVFKALLVLQELEAQQLQISELDKL